MNGKANNKKPRTIYAPQQVCYLEEKFAEQDFPNRTKRKMFAEYLHLSESHVQVSYTVGTRLLNAIFYRFGFKTRELNRRGSRR